MLHINYALTNTWTLKILYKQTAALFKTFPEISWILLGVQIDYSHMNLTPT